MKIGIGLTTYNRPDVLRYALRYFHRFTPEHFTGVVVNDGAPLVGDGNILPPGWALVQNNPRLGIAKAKNRCLELLAHCDFIFLFDDDCFPVAQGWWQPFLEDGGHHYVFASPVCGLHSAHGAMNWWKDSHGCCLMVDKKVLEVCGGFCPDFGSYGYEHVEYTRRIHRAGLTPHPHIAPANALELFWSFDVQRGREDFRWIGGNSSIGPEEKKAAVAANEPVWQRAASLPLFQPFK